MKRSVTEISEAQSLESLGFEKDQIVTVNNHDIIASGSKMRIIRSSAKMGSVVGRLLDSNHPLHLLTVTVNAVCLEKI